MAKRAFGRAFILVVAFFMGSAGGLAARADDRPEPKRWVLTDPHLDGSRTLIVIDEDPTYREDPTVLSQRVVYKKKFAAADAAEFEATKARFESERPTDLHAFARESRLAKPLWVAVKDEWTRSDEDAYSAWFAANVRSDFLQGTGLNADCADVGVTFRWVYARINHLPIANTMAGSGKLFGNFTASAAWDKLPSNPDWRRDERFKAALRELYDETYTWSITDDQFPVAITRQYVRPGSMYMILRSQSGHTQTIHSISDTGGIETFWGNEPAAEAIYDSGLIVEYRNSRGFLNWRHVRRTTVGGKDRWTLIPGTQMPGYSREQFETGYADGSDWVHWVLARLGYVFTDEQRYAIFAKTFEQSIDFRRSITGGGALYCGPGNPCSPAGADYDNYSTFSRDARLRDLRNEMRALGALLGPQNTAVRAAKAALEARGEVALGTGVSYYDAFARDGVLETWSPDPNVTYLARWGSTVAPTATGALLAAADAFLGGIRIRESLVQSAWYQCHYWHCRGDEPSLKAVETSRLDGRIRAAYANLMTLASNGGIGTSTRDALNAIYRKVPLANVTSMECIETGSRCTAYDVTWGFEARMRIGNWTSNPTDAITSRWGL